MNLLTERGMRVKGFLVKQIRVDLGLRQEDLAIKLGVDRTTISYHEGRGSWPDDLLIKTATVLNAPELLIHDDTPMNAVWLGRVSHPLEAISWLREELQEAIDLLDAQERDIRRGITDKETHRRYGSQVYDLHTSAGQYFVSMSRYDMMDIVEIHEDHLVKVDKYRTKTDGKEVAA